MTTEQFIISELDKAIITIYGQPAPQAVLQLQITRKDVEGDYTAMMFPLLKISKQSPEQTGDAVGKQLQAQCSEIESYNVVKGFLNIKLSAEYWRKQIAEIAQTTNYGFLSSTNKTIMVEFSSPNTNKPLHLGHVRNNLLGYSVAKLLEANGHKVIKVNLVNDRGIHICKSMVAWQEFGKGKTPKTSRKKGDRLVGDYYVLFDKKYKRQQADLKAQGKNDEEAAKQAPIMLKAQEMLRQWEEGIPAVVDLWEMMNAWVYAGFKKTYKKLGISFDKTYFESKTYLLGKKIVEEGLQKNVFVRKDDGSVWCDLTSDGLDQKLLLRSDGTSVYMTQDLGTSQQRFSEYHLDEHVYIDEHIYIVGNEQEYHFKALKLILKKLGYDWADAIYHLSYGMVELPEGKMKSREGTVVDADGLMREMIRTAREMSLEHGKLNDISKYKQNKLSRTIGLGALKYFILKVDPKKTMLFDPKESIDFNGNTGPFIQYTHARIKSVLRKAEEQKLQSNINSAWLNNKEIELVKLLNIFPAKIAEAGAEHSPALIANYAYELAKEFNQYYHDVSILKEPDADTQSQRLVLIAQIASVLKTAMSILGIEVPERM